MGKLEELILEVGDMHKDLERQFNPDVRISLCRILDAQEELCEQYSSAIQKDYENQDEALECLRAYFKSIYSQLPKLEDYSNHRVLKRVLGFTDFENSAIVNEALARKFLIVNEALARKAKNPQTHRLVKSILRRGLVLSDPDFTSLKRIKELSEVEDEICELIDKETENIENSFPINLLETKPIAYRLEILSQGEITSAGELVECSGFEVEGYLPIKKIGQGQTRRVFKVKHRGREQVLALKIDIPEHEIKHPRAIEVIRLLHQNGLSKRERTALMDLTHENLARMWDFSSCNGRGYIVEDYVDGTTLKDLVKQKGKLTIRELILAFTPILRAMEYLEEHRYIHRDIKPDNILVSNDFRTVKLTDMQNAVKVDNSGQYIGESFGSYNTMAPELLLEGKASHLSDLYSVGVCMHYALFGKMPYDLGDGNLEDVKRRLEPRNFLDGIMFRRLWMLGQRGYTDVPNMPDGTPISIPQLHRNPEERFSINPTREIIYDIMGNFIAISPESRKIQKTPLLHRLEKSYLEVNTDKI